MSEVWLDGTALDEEVTNPTYMTYVYTDLGQIENILRGQRGPDVCMSQRVIGAKANEGTT